MRETGRVDRIDTARALYPHPDKTGLAKDLEMLGNCRLGDRAMTLHGFDHASRRLFAASENLQNLATFALTKRIKDGVHLIGDGAVRRVEVSASFCCFSCCFNRVAVVDGGVSPCRCS